MKKAPPVKGTVPRSLESRCERQSHTRIPKGLDGGIIPTYEACVLLALVVVPFVNGKAILIHGENVSDMVNTIVIKDSNSTDRWRAVG